MLCIEHEDSSASELLSRYQKTWASSVVVPVRAERRERLKRLIDSLEVAASTDPRKNPVLLILVLNSKESALKIDASRNNEVRELLKSYSHPLLDICLLDHACSSRSFPEKSGVGQARRLGCDLAVKLEKAGLFTDPWVRCTDADAEVSPDYFSPLAQDCAAVIFPFRHTLADDERTARAAVIYDLYLRYLRLGMRGAGSTFSYHSIGSLIAFQASVYRMIRGFPDVEAGEDFYFLNKIRKQGRVDWAVGRQPLRLEGRVSTRVPFGTGRSITRILSEGPDSWAFYNPQSFAVLGKALEILKAGPSALTPESCGRFYEFVLQRRMLDKFESIASQCKKRPEQWNARSLELFDAFEQMKFLHFLRDKDCDSVDWRVACRDAWFLDPKIRQSSDDLGKIHDLLIVTDESTPFV